MSFYFVFGHQRPAIAESNSDFESAPASALVGTSGTLMKINLGSRSSLAPGEVLRVPIWIRGVGGGKQTLKLLLHYTRASIDGAPQRFVRYVRYECEVCQCSSERPPYGAMNKERVHLPRQCTGLRTSIYARLCYRSAKLA